MSKKKIIAVMSVVVVLSVLLAFGMLLLIGQKNVAETSNVLGIEWYDVSKSEFTIKTADELYELAKLSHFYNFENQTIKLGADIVINEGNAVDWSDDAPSRKWSPIKNFAGVFDGQGHTISGLYAKAYESPRALFVDSAQSCTIQNLSLKNSYFNVSGRAGVASFMAGGGGNFIKLYSDAIIHNKGQLTGGIGTKANKQASFKECWFDGQIVASEAYVGGILAVANAGRVEIQHCLFSGNIESNFEDETSVLRLGGVTGHVMADSALIIKDTLVEGSITVQGSYQSGSFVGRKENTANVSVSESYVAADTNLAGMIGSGTMNDGLPLQMSKESIQGVKAYQWMALDFDTYWAVVENAEPVLKQFAENTMSLAGVEKNYDTSWYIEGLGPYYIENAKQLYGLAMLSMKDDFADQQIFLEADIVLSEGNASEWSDSKKAPQSPWFSIGTSQNPFAGIFDGQGHTISGLYFSRNQEADGLFGATATQSVVRNFKLINSFVESQEAWLLGSIVGLMHGSMDTVYSDAIIHSSGGSTIGGLVGRFYYNDTLLMAEPEISNCWFDGKIYGEAYTVAGGIAGQIRRNPNISDVDAQSCKMRITNCLNTGILTNDREGNQDKKGGQYMGGILGRDSNATNITISGCLNAGTIDLKYHTYAGSLTGRIANDATEITIQDSYIISGTHKNKMGEVLGTKNGDVIVFDKEALTGYNSYKYTKLDFKKYWSVVLEEIPILTSFCKSSSNVKNQKRLVNTDWYQKDAKELTIKTKEELYGLWYLSNYYTFAGQTIKLGADITINSVDSGILTAWEKGTKEGEDNWFPIGSTEKPFAGNFDGQFHTIRGLYANTGRTNIGLFGTTDTGSVIRNLRLVDCCFYYMRTDASDIGSIAGESRGVIDTVYSNAIIKTNGCLVGGIAGNIRYNDTGFQAKVGIENCWFDGKILGTSVREAGGIVGVLRRNSKIETADVKKTHIQITNCLNSGYLSNEREGSKDGFGGQNVGGIVGKDRQAVKVTIDSCMNVGILDFQYKTYLGAFVGRTATKESIYQISNSFASEEGFATAVTVGDASTINHTAILPVKELLGHNGYKHTSLDFKNYWAVVTESTPILKSFATSVPKVEGIQADISWYRESADKMTVDSVEDFYGFWVLSHSKSFKGQTIELGDDIILNQVTETELDDWKTGKKIPTNIWKPIGGEEGTFLGSFHGQGHKISGLYMNYPTDEIWGIGIFAAIGIGASAEDFILENSFIYNGGNNTGSVAGSLQGSIKDIYVTESVTVRSNRNSHGGIVGIMSSTEDVDITKCWFAGEVDNTSTSGVYIGGIVGRIYSKGIKTVSDCLNTGTIRGLNKGDTGMGGISGVADSNGTAKLTSCLNLGNIYAASGASGVGGVLGKANNETVKVKNCYTIRDYSGYGNSVVSTNSAISGMPAKLDKASLTGAKAGLYTKLDFYTKNNEDGVWTVSESGTPELKKFSKVTSVTNFEGQQVDATWYYNKVTNVDEEGNKTAAFINRTYEIDTLSKFYGFANIVSFNDDDFANEIIKLTDDMIAENQDWHPIGLEFDDEGNYVDRAFSGTFDGNYHTISGLVSDYFTGRSDEVWSVGLFAKLANSGTVKNLKLSNCKFFGHGNNIGAVVGISYGKLRDIYVDNTVHVKSSRNALGGITGVVGNSGNITPEIKTCWFAGVVENTGSNRQNIGGIIGRIAAGSSKTVLLENCLCTGTVQVASTDAVYTGGLVGRVTNKVQIKNCMNLATVTAGKNVTALGAVVGGAETSAVMTFENVYTSNAIAALGTGTGGVATSTNITGAPIAMEAGELEGAKAYSNTMLDFWSLTNKDGIWTVATIGKPQLKKFATVTSIEDFSSYDKFNLEWYYNELHNLQGVESANYQIGTAGELYGLAYLVNQRVDADMFAGDTVTLTENIIVNRNAPTTRSEWADYIVRKNPRTWTPIGKNTTGYRFAGTFNGNGKTISGIYCTGKSQLGLFGSGLSGTVLKNFRLVNSYFSGSYQFGSILGVGCGKMSNIYSNAVVTCSSDGSQIGGFFGRLRDGKVDVENCWFDGEVYGTTLLGGLTGEILSLANTDSVIKNFLFTGVVESYVTTEGQKFTGGIIGKSWNSTTGTKIQNCLAVGTIQMAGSSSTNVGAVIGQKLGTETYTNVYASTVNGYYVSGTSNGSTTLSGATALSDNTWLAGNTLKEKTSALGWGSEFTTNVTTGEPEIIFNYQ